MIPVFLAKMLRRKYRDHGRRNREQRAAAARVRRTVSEHSVRGHRARRYRAARTTRRAPHVPRRGPCRSRAGSGRRRRRLASRRRCPARRAQPPGRRRTSPSGRAAACRARAGGPMARSAGMPSRGHSGPRRSACRAPCCRREQRPGRCARGLLARSVSRRVGAAARPRRAGPARGHLDRIRACCRKYSLYREFSGVSTISESVSRDGTRRPRGSSRRSRPAGGCAAVRRTTRRTGARPGRQPSWCSRRRSSYRTTHS